MNPNNQTQSNYNSSCQSIANRALDSQVPMPSKQIGGKRKRKTQKHKKSKKRHNKTMKKRHNKRRHKKSHKRRQRHKKSHKRRH